MVLTIISVTKLPSITYHKITFSQSLYISFDFAIVLGNCSELLVYMGSAVHLPNFKSNGGVKRGLIKGRFKRLGI